MSDQRAGDIVKRLICKMRGHVMCSGCIYCHRCGTVQSIPYDVLAPQDQVDRIAHEKGLSFDAALDVWAERHGVD